MAKNTSSITILPLWDNQGKFFPLETDVVADEEHYKQQCSQFGSYLILKDKDYAVKVNTHENIQCTLPLKFPNKGELIAGSSVAAMVALKIGNVELNAGDIDIYFKSKEDAMEFCKLNQFAIIDTWENPMCQYYTLIRAYDKVNINMIYGVDYISPEDLITHFDIRACSMAFDPNNSRVYTVEGSIRDCTNKKITFNPIPRSASLRRLVKYVEKGFTISSYQRLFCVELLKSDLYSAELELNTSNY